MRDLLSRLAFTIPNSHPQGSLPVLVDQATAHIRQLKERVEMLKQMKEHLEGHTDHEHIVRPTMITVSELDSEVLEICLTTGLTTDNSILSQVIDVLMEEAAQIVSVNYSVAGDRIIHTIHAEAVSARIGIQTSRVEERLKQLISPTTDC